MGLFGLFGKKTPAKVEKPSVVFSCIAQSVLKDLDDVDNWEEDFSQFGSVPMLKYKNKYTLYLTDLNISLLEVSDSNIFTIEEQKAIGEKVKLIRQKFSEKRTQAGREKDLIKLKELFPHCYIV